MSTPTGKGATPTPSALFTPPYSPMVHPTGGPYPLQQEGSHNNVNIGAADQWPTTSPGSFPLNQEGHGGVSIGGAVSNAKGLGDLSAP